MLATDLGYTFRQIDAMYLDDVSVLQRYWRNDPPLRVFVAGIAAALGWKPLPRSSSDEAPALPPEFEE